MGNLITRRLAIGALSAFAALFSSRAALPAAPLRIESRLAALAASNRQSARAIGQAYLRSHIDRAAIAGLPETIIGELGLDAQAAHELSDRALRKRIDRAIRADFVRYQTEMLGGWVLARTELRLCALVALGY